MVINGVSPLTLSRSLSFPVSLSFQLRSSIGWNNIGLGEELWQALGQTMSIYALHLQNINNPFPRCALFTDAFASYETDV